MKYANNLPKFSDELQENDESKDEPIIENSHKESAQSHNVKVQQNKFRKEVNKENNVPSKSQNDYASINEMKIKRKHKTQIKKPEWNRII